MRFLKKYYKLIGTIVTVIALVFVVKKIVTMDVDWSMFASGRLIAMITGCVLIQTAVILFVRDKYSHERCTAGVYQVESDEICAGQCFSVCGQKPACRRPSYQPRGRSLCHCAGYRLLHADAAAADRGAYGKEYAGTDPHIP